MLDDATAASKVYVAFEAVIAVAPLPRLITFAEPEEIVIVSLFRLNPIPLPAANVTVFVVPAASAIVKVGAAVPPTVVVTLSKVGSVLCSTTFEVEFQTSTLSLSLPAGTVLS